MKEKEVYSQSQLDHWLLFFQWHLGQAQGLLVHQPSSSQGTFGVLLSKGIVSALCQVSSWELETSELCSPLGAELPPS